MDETQQPQTTSPVPMAQDAVVVDEGMTFAEAMVELIAGQSIKRKDWGDIDEYGLMKDGWLTIHKAASNRFDIWKVSDGDMLAEDWFVVKRSN